MLDMPSALPALLWTFCAGLVAALCLQVAVATSLELGFESDGQGVAMASAAGPADGFRAQAVRDVNRTYMQCLGTQTMTRACHFQNVYYELKTSRFVHYGVAGARPSVFGDAHRQNEPWLRLVR